MSWYRDISIRLVEYAPLTFWLGLTPEEVAEWCKTMKRSAKK